MELTCGFGRAAAYIAEAQVLESPFVLVDVGARGGIHGRWRPFEPAMRVFGFDAEILETAPNKRHTFFEMAVGDRDGECFISTPDNRCESRIANSGRPVQIRRLDTLYASGLIPPADFIKIDVEGYEPHVLAGARAYLGESNLTGADLETTFNPALGLSQSHLTAVTAALLEHGLRVADFACDRPGMRNGLVWPGTCNALFLRDRTRSGQYGADAVLKTIAVLDVYGLTAQAYAVLNANRLVISRRLDPNAIERRLRPTMVGTIVAQLEGRLPHFGFGIWTAAKRIISLGARA